MRGGRKAPRPSSARTRPAGGVRFPNRREPPGNSGGRHFTGIPRAACTPLAQVRRTILPGAWVGWQQCASRSSMPAARPPPRRPWSGAATPAGGRGCAERGGAASIIGAEPAGGWPRHQAVVGARAQPQRTDAGVRVHQRVLLACPDVRQISRFHRPQKACVFRVALLIGSRFTRPRRHAKLRSPDRLALREELLELSTRTSGVDLGRERSFAP